MKPPALRLGDTIGIVAPASNIKQSDLEAGAAALRRAGYETFYLDSIIERDLYFAGPPDRRARELEEMFSRDEVRAILCARGGYGANYLLNGLNLEIVKAYPKIFIGYSDITSLLTYLVDAAGLTVFHGPMAAKDWAHDDAVDISSWKLALSSGESWEVPLNAGVTALADGEAEGVLYGGCLSILVASLGTPYEIKTEGKLLFLEDIAAKPFQIDRMLMQLKLSGHMDLIRGIIFGEMLECTQSQNQGYTLPQVIQRVVGDLGIPVVFGVRSGHTTSGNITLPFGVKSKLCVSEGCITLKVLESSVRV